MAEGGYCDEYFRADGGESSQAREVLSRLNRICAKCGFEQQVFVVEEDSACNDDNTVKELKAEEQTRCPKCNGDLDLISSETFREILIALAVDLGEDIGVASRGVPTCPRSWTIRYRYENPGTHDSLDVAEKVDAIDKLLQEKAQGGEILRPIERIVSIEQKPNGWGCLAASICDPFEPAKLEWLQKQWTENNFSDFATLVEARSNIRRSKKIVRTGRQKALTAMLFIAGFVLLALLGRSI